MTTTIISNGSRWAGEELRTLEELIAVLGSNPLCAQFGPFIHTSEATGATRFFGNFEKISHVFHIDTTDKDTIDALTEAIAANLRRPDYKPLPKRPKNANPIEVQAPLI